MMRPILLVTCLIIALLPSLALADGDARMQIELNAGKLDVQPAWLQSHIKKAAEMALPVLWQRIVPAHAINQMPKKPNALRFLKKASPNVNGVTILFNEKRVFDYLKQNRIPFYAEQHAEATAPEPDTSMPAIDQPAPVMSTPAAPVITLLSIERHASLPEQVLLEEDLAKDPHVQSLILQQVNSFGQQYRLRLKQPGDSWLTTWFTNRGMTLTQTVDGWLAR